MTSWFNTERYDGGPPPPPPPPHPRGGPGSFTKRLQLPRFLTSADSPAPDRRPRRIVAGAEGPPSVGEPDDRPARGLFVSGPFGGYVCLSAVLVDVEEGRRRQLAQEIVGERFPAVTRCPESRDHRQSARAGEPSAGKRQSPGRTAMPLAPGFVQSLPFRQTSATTVGWPGAGTSDASRPARTLRLGPSRLRTRFRLQLPGGIAHGSVTCTLRFHSSASRQDSARSWRVKWRISRLPRRRQFR
jgi:hypothetical protein